MRAIDGDALEELFREVISGIAKKPEMNGNLEHMVRASAMVIEMIQDAPTIDPEPHWIPVSERLPERGKDVLVTRDYDGREDFNKSCRYVEVASSYGEEDAITWNSYSDEYKMTPKNHHVIAWMPLPEPYREDGE